MTPANVAPVDPWEVLETKPDETCDLVMKGGVTSGIVYPKAIVEFARDYRLVGVGGASAGAIGAAFAAAAEHGRESGGFKELSEIPGELGGGGLRRLFQAQFMLRPLLRLMIVLTTLPSALRILLLPLWLPVVFPTATIIGAGGGWALAWWARESGDLSGTAGQIMAWVIFIGLWLLVVVARILFALLVTLPRNAFGICRGGRVRFKRRPGLTEWLSTQIDRLAGVSAPLTFGDLWGSEEGNDDPKKREIDLRMVTSCLSRSRPYELPWATKNFFYDPVVWGTMFPPDVMKALAENPARGGSALLNEDLGGRKRLRDEEANENAAAKKRKLVRLPDAFDLPVVVAVRMSLSFPLLISALPLFAVDHRRSKGKDIVFEDLWFTDGGFCSNFPLLMFDKPLPTRPTFAINLGKFSEDSMQVKDERLEKNIDYAKRNSFGVLPAHREVKTMAGFGVAAVDTMRNWQDNSYLDMPGYRDRIVRVMQTSRQGGLNLTMSRKTIDRLALRGEIAGKALSHQFRSVTYGQFTGWQNHRWVRFRGLMATVPEFFQGYLEARKEHDDLSTKLPTLSLNEGDRKVLKSITLAIDGVATAVMDSNESSLKEITSRPRPRGVLRRASRM